MRAIDSMCAQASRRVAPRIQYDTAPQECAPIRGPHARRAAPRRAETYMRRRRTRRLELRSIASCALPNVRRRGRRRITVSKKLGARMQELASVKQQTGHAPHHPSSSVISHQSSPHPHADRNTNICRCTRTHLILRYERRSTEYE